MCGFLLRRGAVPQRGHHRETISRSERTAISAVPSALAVGGRTGFLVEGTFDALSSKELGYRGVAINGAGNWEKIANLLRRRKRPGPILLLPDRNPAGEQWVQVLLDIFPRLYCCPPGLCGKELNESLLEHREATADYLAEQVHQALAALPPTCWATIAKLNAFQDLLAQVQAVKGRRRLTTGVSPLDLAG